MAIFRQLRGRSVPYAIEYVGQPTAYGEYDHDEHDF